MRVASVYVCTRVIRKKKVIGLKGRLIFPSPLSWSVLTKTYGKRPEKIIPWQQHHLRLGVTVPKPNSLCRHADEAVVVALMFITVAMEKPNLLYLPVVAEEEEKTNLQYQ
jgi:hypothetical protein